VKVTPGGGPAKAPAGAAAFLGATAPAAPGGAADETSDADGPCFEFRQVIDDDGNPVMRKFQVPCPEK
jgi:hypothetical protein